MIEVFGARVRQARLLRRMTATSVVEATGWSNARQSKIEKASTMWLSIEDVDRLAELFRFPSAFFGTEPQSRVAAKELLFRAPKSMTVGEQEFLATFASLAGDFLGDLDSLSKLPPVRIPSVVEDGPRRMSIAGAAARLREAMGVEPDEPLDDLMYEAERLGAPVIVRRRVPGEWESEFAATPGRTRHEKHLGYSSWVGRHRDRPLLVLRETESWERTRFTVGHELGHLMLHSRAYCSVSSSEEQDANRFATELLAPAAVIAHELPRAMSLLNLKPVNDKWGISLVSLIMHLRDSGVINQARAKMLTTQLHSRINPSTGHTRGMTEPGWKDRVVERPRLLRKWVERCYGSASVPMLTARDSMIFPPDLLEWFLATQRPAPGVDRQPVAASIGAIGAGDSRADGPPRVIRLELEDFRRDRTL
jgi:Zn-dependent peptidase ImmA (M78 family)/transcriptional regulator with XRE-family HTH domain